jgi:Nucleoside 2-deoxyribosyltransferase like
LAAILTPPTWRTPARRVIFLAGPIQGAPDWQREAIAFFEPAPDLLVASPRRPLPDMSEAGYDEQVRWEHHYLDRAARDGAILFWLAREAVHFCDRAYAQTTRFELGEAVTLHRWRGVRVVVGIEDGFSGARYLRRTIAAKAPAIPLCTTLQQTCETALKLVAL